MNELLDQIELIYEEWARDPKINEQCARLIFGLFEIAKEHRPERMAQAFRRGVGR